MEKYDFIKLMLKSRNLSVNDKKRLVLLATREIEKNENNTKEDGTKAPEEEKPLKKNKSMLRKIPQRFFRCSIMKMASSF